MFTALLTAAVLIGSIFPATGPWADGVGVLAKTLIVSLFFLHGVRMQPERLRAALVDWRLHGVILTATYLAFPLLGVLLHTVMPDLLPPALWVGVLFLCAVPSTVQSSIAFTSIAGGNVAATLTAAAASNIIGIGLTPVVISIIGQSQAASFSFAGVGDIVLLLLVPFAAGQLSRRWLLTFAMRHASLLSFVDRATIVVAIYGAFSAAARSGAWQTITPLHIAILIGVCCVLLALALLLTRYGARALKFAREDEISIVFCGSKKSLVSGIPMARVLFTDAQFGAAVLPLIIFHQLQLVVCAWLARRYAAQLVRIKPGAASEPG